MRLVCVLLFVFALAVHADGTRSGEAEAIVLGGDNAFATGFLGAPVPRSWRHVDPSSSGASRLAPEPARKVSLKTVFLEVNAKPRAKRVVRRLIRRVVKRVAPRGLQHAPAHHVRFQQLKAAHALAKTHKKAKRVVIKKVAAKHRLQAKTRTHAKAQSTAQARAEARAELKAAAEVLSELTALAEAAAAAESSAHAHEGSSGSSGEGSEDSGPVYILPLAPMSWATLPQGSGSPGGGAPSDTPGQPMGSNSMGAQSS